MAGEGAGLAMGLMMAGMGTATGYRIFITISNPATIARAVAIGIGIGIGAATGVGAHAAGAVIHALAATSGTAAAGSAVNSAAAVSAVNSDIAMDDADITSATGRAAWIRAGWRFRGSREIHFTL